MSPTASDRPPDGGAGSKDQYESNDSVTQGDRNHKDQGTGTTAGALDGSTPDLAKAGSPRVGACVAADQQKGSNSPLPIGRQACSARAACSPTKRCTAGSEAAEAAASAGGDDRSQAHAAAVSTQQQPNRVAVAVRPLSLAGALPAGADGSSSSVSPSQQQPRGWAAMLPSPEQEQKGNVFAVDRDSSSSGITVQLQDQSLPLYLPCLSPTDGPSEAANISDEAVADLQPSSSGDSSSAAQRFSPSRIGGRQLRPTPLVVPNSNTRPSSSSIGADVPAAGSSRLSQSQIPSSPAAMQHGSTVRNRPALVIPQSPLSAAGCLTPAGLLSPNAMARPYQGPPLCVEDLDLDAIDDVPPANDGIPISNSSSPVIGGPGSVMRSGGLRASRDQDLRRCALMNMLSPRPASMPPTSPSLFTGETRARALGAASSNSSCSSTPVGPVAAGTASSSSSAGTAVEGEAAAQAYTMADRMQQLLSSSSSRSRGGSPALTASPVGGSILDQARPGSRSVPVTPASRYNVAAQLLHAGGSCGAPSVSSSMTASPVVPSPSHGPAAALLAGSVIASPRTPRSPLSAMFSPARSAALGLPSAGQMQHLGIAAALPPPLFGAGGGFNPPGSAGAARLVPMSPGSSRLSAASPSVAGFVVEPAGPQQQQQQQAVEDASQAEQPLIPANVDQVPNAVPIALEITSEVSLPHGPHGPESPALVHAQQPEHLAQVLRQNLQLHDTRFGPHGESPLSPSHHSALLQQQHSSEGGLRLSPTRPTPLVPPALATAAAVPAPLDAPTSPTAYAGLIGVFSRSASGTAAEAAAAYDAAAAADASEVMDVGRMDVHEWLDQHSWPFRYELPTRLRDAADLVHGQGGIRPPGQVSVTAAGPSGGHSLESGHFWLQQQGLLRTSTEDFIRQQQAAAGTSGTSALVQQIAAAVQAGDSAVRLPNSTSAWQRSSFTHIVDHGGASSRPHSRLGDAPDVHGCSISQDGNDDCSAAAGGDMAGRILVTASSRAGDSLLPLAAAAVGGGSVAAARYVASDSHHMFSHGNEAGSQAADTPSMAQQQQQQQSPGVVRNARHGSSNARLLSPGRHRYAAASPVAQDSSPITSPQPGATTAAAAAAGSAASSRTHGTGDNSSSGGSSGSSSGWQGRTVASAGAVVDPSPLGSMQQHWQLFSGRVPSVEEQLQQIQQLQAQRQRQLQLIQQQRQHQNRVSAEAATPSAPAERNAATHSMAARGASREMAIALDEIGAGLQPDSNVVGEQLLDSNVVGEQQLEEQLELRGSKGLVQAPALLLGSCTLATGRAAPSTGCDVLDITADEARLRAVNTTAAAAAAVATAAVARRQATSELLRDEQYLSRLLGELPGVDWASPVVQQAMKDLQLKDAADLEQ